MSQEQEERFGKRVSEIIDANREALSLLADDEPKDPAWQYAFDLEARLKEALEARERAEGERTQLAEIAIEHGACHCIWDEFEDDDGTLSDRVETYAGDCPVHRIIEPNLAAAWPVPASPEAAVEGEE